jgi:hypothetical protein
MPTIEIVSFDSTGLELNQADFFVAIIEENKLISHRALFADFLQEQNGAIVHVGNPDFRDDKDGPFFAGLTVDWDADTPKGYFRFLDQYKPNIDKLLNIALGKSPIKRICFLTDYQFGPKKKKFVILDTIKGFWNKHDRRGLRFNTMYEIY